MKLAQLRKLHRLHCLLPASEVITDGIVESHSVSHSFPMHGCKGSVWLDGRGKVGRQSRFGQNLPPAERIQPENLATACHTLEEHPATETSDWREIRKWLTDEAGYWCFICNAKIKAFRSQFRGVGDIKFFMFRLATLYS